MCSHQQKIIDQFTQQAIPFTQIAGHHDAIDLLIKMAEPKQSDTVLDVACGPGIVTCAFARQCGHATGLDLTPAMIEQARQRQMAQGGPMSPGSSTPAYLCPLPMGSFRWW